MECALTMKYYTIQGLLDDVLDIKKSCICTSETYRIATILENKMVELCAGSAKLDGIINRDPSSNVHENCEYYNRKHDSCSNYGMGKHAGLARNVSHLMGCISDYVD